MAFYSRKSPRIPNFDYSSENYYFITICTHSRKCMFGLPEEKTKLGNIAEQNIKILANHYNKVHIDKYVVMPNHVHLILVTEKDNKANAAQVVGQYKSGVTRAARKIFPGIKLWQRSFHDHIIRNQQQYELIWTYIENNPQKWEEDCFYVQMCET